MSLWVRLVIAIVALSVLIAVGVWKPRDRHLRGRTVDLDSKSRRKRSSQTEAGQLRWGGEYLPRSAENMHFLVVGTTGSGKTLTINRLMADVLPRIGSVPDQRALVYDAKQDTLPFLRSLELSCPVHTLDPFDAAGVAWAVGQDVNNEATSRQLAFDLIVPTKKEDPYFVPAARDVLWGVVLGFIEHAGENWTLRDVVLATRSWERLKGVLYSTRGGRDRFDSHLGRSERQGGGVLGTLRANLAGLEVVAALWQHAKETVSLTEWALSESVLVLGNNELARASIDVLNRLMIRRATQLVLDQQDSATRRTWLVLDEVRDAAELDSLPAFLTKARSKGGCAVLGYQDNEGMKHVYGTHLAQELMAMCSHKAILRLESPTTAKWASSIFGENERIEIRKSVSSGGLKRGARTRSEQRVKSDVVLASEFMSIPPTNLENGLTGYYLTPFAPMPFRDTAPLEEVLVGPVFDEGREEWAFVARPDSAQRLEPWTPKDERRLGIELGLELELEEEAQPALQLG